MSQRWPPPKPRLTQETFDESVNTNIEDFDMTPEEAVKSAVEEFKVQGFDMSGIVAKHGMSTDTHAIAIATRALEEALGVVAAAAEGSDATAAAATPSGLVQLLSGLKEALASGGTTVADAKERNAVAVKCKTFKPVFQACLTLSSTASPTASGAEGREGLLLALSLARQLLLMSLEIRDMFDDVQGGVKTNEMLAAHKSDQEVQAAIAAFAEAASLKEEANKASLVASGFALACLELLHEFAAQPPSPPLAPTTVADADAAGEEAKEGTKTGDSTSSPSPPSSPVLLKLGAIRGLCGVLRALLTADDDRPHVVGSAAFKNARTLAKEGRASAALMGTLRLEEVAAHPSTCSAVLTAIKQFAANDEICKEFLDDGAVLASLAIARRWLHSSEVVSAAVGALRLLSSSDGVKKMMAENGGIEQILTVMAAHEGEDSVLEPALALLASLMLRMPEVATKAAEVGALDGIVEAMTSRSASGPVQRQACMAIRNMAVRNPELRPLIAEKGLEELIRIAKATHASTCGDVGAAALRDMGCDNYNSNDLPAWIEEAPKGGIPRGDP